jgi:DNA-binding beta-propeller fold protein YncE
MLALMRILGLAVPSFIAAVCLASGTPAATQAVQGELNLPGTWVHHVASLPCVDGGTGLGFSPLGVAYDMGGDLYVVDSENSRILVHADSSGPMGFFATCPLTSAGCQFVDIEADAGWFHVSERSGGSIITYDSRGAAVASADVGAGIGGIGLGGSGLVYGAMTLSGSIAIVDVYGDRSPVVCPISGDGDGSYPVDCLVEKSRADRQGRVLVTDAFSKKVLILSLLGHPEGSLHGFDFKGPFGLATYLDRFVLVTDSELACVALFDYEGKFLGAFGQGWLKTPTFAAARDDGTISVADPGRMTIEVFRIDDLPNE